MNEIITKIIEIFLAGGAGAGLFWLFGEKWIENKFAKELETYKTLQLRELEHFKAKTNSIFVQINKLNEKELEVLPEAWNRLQIALGRVNVITAVFQEYPDIGKMKDEELSEQLRKDKFWSDYEMKTIFQTSQPDKNQIYQKMIFWKELNLANNAYSDFHNYLCYNKIFLNRELFLKFDEIDGFIRNVMNDVRTGKEDSFRKIFSEASKRFREKSPEMTQSIEDVIQKRLHLGEMEE